MISVASGTISPSMGQNHKVWNTTMGNATHLIEEHYSMAHLPQHPTLKDLQNYVDEVCKERGWTKDNYAEKFLLFTEEVGELAKAIRKTAGLYDEKARQKNVDLAEEFADVLSYLLDLANYFQIDLEQAFREKEQINQTRIWE
jgi:NTP pyrophosphatase (non-canonical NTP hydrolase)